ERGNYVFLAWRFRDSIIFCRNRLSFLWKFFDRDRDTLVHSLLFTRGLKDSSRDGHHVGIFHSRLFRTRSLQCVKYTAHSCVLLPLSPFVSLPCSNSRSSDAHIDPAEFARLALRPRKNPHSSHGLQSRDAPH